MVEYCCLKPCWWVVFGMFCVMCGRIIFSSILAIGESREMGLYEVPWFGSLFGFGIGMILAVFHICGMMLRLSDRL